MIAEQLTFSPHPSVVCSLLRSAGVEPSTMRWHADRPSTVATWWGVELEAEEGATIHYFKTPLGIAVEAVEPPERADGEP